MAVKLRWDVQQGQELYKKDTIQTFSAATEAYLVSQKMAEYVESHIPNAPILVEELEMETDIAKDLENYTLEELKDIAEQIELTLTETKKANVIQEIIASGRASEFFED